MYTDLMALTVLLKYQQVAMNITKHEYKFSHCFTAVRTMIICIQGPHSFTAVPMSSYDHTMYTSILTVLLQYQQVAMIIPCIQVFSQFYCSTNYDHMYTSALTVLLQYQRVAMIIPCIQVLTVLLQYQQVAMIISYIQVFSVLLQYQLVAMIISCIQWFPQPDNCVIKEGKVN